jgi:hypothetical protein
VGFLRLFPASCILDVAKGGTIEVALKSCGWEVVEAQAGWITTSANRTWNRATLSDNSDATSPKAIGNKCDFSPHQDDWEIPVFALAYRPLYA